MASETIAEPFCPIPHQRQADSPQPQNNDAFSCKIGGAGIAERHQAILPARSRLRYAAARRSNVYENLKHLTPT